MKLYPLKYFGGKNSMLNNLLSLIPPHKSYVEVFAGGARLLFTKTPSQIEVLNDIEGNLVNFFKVLRDEEKYKKLQELLKKTPYSRDEFYFCRDYLDEENIDDVERARRFFVVIRQSFCACGRDFGYTKSFKRKLSKTFYNVIDFFPIFHERIRNVIIENLDFRDCIRRYDTEDTFFYCDPPYVLSTRSGKAYQYEMTDEDHKELVDILLRIKGMAMISGRKNEIYEELERHGWLRLDFVIMNPSYYVPGMKEKKKVTDSVWLCPKTKINYLHREIHCHKVLRDEGKYKLIGEGSWKL